MAVRDRYRARAAIGDKPCPRCGGKSEIKATVESSADSSIVDFYQCKDCDHVHSVEK